MYDSNFHTYRDNMLQNEIGTPAKTLKVFLAEIKAILEKNTHEEWIEAEIANFMVDRNGHGYIDLVEMVDNKEVAKVKAIIWKYQLPGIVSKFRKTTNSQLSAGIKVKVKVKLNFSEVYSLSVIIQDIDPSFTLGKLEANKIVILKRLEEENLLNRNKQYPSPFHYSKVAVISSKDAAGLSDFKKEADGLTSLGLCLFKYYDVAVQGNNTAQSIVTALREVYRAQVDGAAFDVAVIIRGGGSVLDLNCFNDYSIAFAVCHMNLPVYIGIGHEKDHCVLDVVANKSFDTPSKVALHIDKTINTNLTIFEQNFNLIIKNSIALVANIQQKMVISCQSIIYHAYKSFSNAADECTANMTAITNKSGELIDQSNRLVTNRISNLMNDIGVKVDFLNLSSVSLMKNISSSANHIIARTETNIDARFNQITQASHNKLNIIIIRTNNQMSKIIQNAEVGFSWNTNQIVQNSSTIINKAENLLSVCENTASINNITSMIECAQGTMNKTTLEVKSIMNKTLSFAGSSYVLADININAMINQIVNVGQNKLNIVQIKLNHILQEIISNEMTIISFNDNLVIKNITEIINKAEIRLNDCHQQSKNNIALVLANSVTPQLKRGFNLAWSSDMKLISSAAHAHAIGKFNIQFYDGNVNVTVN